MKNLLLSDKILITGCARSGTTFLLECFKNFKKTYVKYPNEFLPTKIFDKYSKYYIDPSEIPDDEILVIKHPRQDKENKSFEHFQKILNLNFKIIYIFRDPRDILCSKLNNKYN